MVKSYPQLVLEEMACTSNIDDMFKTVLSPFGRVITADPEHMGNYTGGGLLPQYQYDKRLLGNGATITNNLNENLWELTVNKAQQGEAIIQTYKVFEYEAAKGHVIWISAAFGDTSGGVIQEYGYGGGYGDSNVAKGDADGMGAIITDGITLRSEDNNISLNLWSSTSGVPIRRTFKREDWDDPLDGTKSCSYIDFTKAVPMKFTFQYLGVGDIKFYVSIKDKFYLAHTIRNSGVYNKPYMRRGSQPLRARIYSPGGGTGTSTLRYICQGVDRLGGGKSGGTPISFTNGFAGYTTPNTTNVPYLLYALRLKEGFNHIAIEPEDGTICSTSGANFAFGFAKNLTFTPSLPVSSGWEDLFGMSSPVEFLVPTTSYVPTVSNKSDNHFWRGTAVQNASSINPRLGGRQLQLSRHLNGVSEVLVAWVANVGSSRSETYNFDFNAFLSSGG